MNEDNYVYQFVGKAMAYVNLVDQRILTAKAAMQKLKQDVTEFKAEQVRQEQQRKTAA